jgi:VIT1/CCC1 family predicted Fe2+/Mn2+ transporter
MNGEKPPQQSTTGKAISGYSKVTGYGNLVGSIIAFIIGGIMILAGILLAFLFGSFFPLVFSGVGLLIVWFGRLGLRWSKKMREGKYYHVGKGWVEPK